MGQLPGYVSAAELADELGITVRELIQMVRAGRIPPPDMLVGGSYWREEQVRALLRLGNIQRTSDETRERVQLSIAGQTITVRTDRPDAVRQAAQELEASVRKLQVTYPNEPLAKILVLHILRTMTEVQDHEEDL